MAGRRDSEPPFFRRRAERQREGRASTARPQESKPLPIEPYDFQFEEADASTESGSLDPHDESTYIEGVKERLAAANEAIRTTRTFSFALLSIAAYIGVVIASTTDEQLLRISPVELPIIGVEVPLTGFYIFVPCLFVLLHFNLLIHLGLTSRKLKGFLDDLESLDGDLSQRLRRDVANFPLAQWMVGNQDKVFRVVLSLLVWILLILIPPLLLLWMQLRFLAFQDETFTWLQAGAVAVDALLIVGFRAWFVKQIQPETRWRSEWKERRRNGYRRLVDYFRLIVSEPLIRYMVPLAPLGLTLLSAIGMTNLLTAERVGSCSPHVPERTPDYWPWLCEWYRLNLGEKLLVQGTPSPENVNALRGVSALLKNDPALEDREEQEQALVRRRHEALDDTLGHDLRQGHLRGANFALALLPKSDLRGAQLEGADLRRARLEWANLTHADLSFANLTGVKNLETAEPGVADFAGADLTGTFLDINQPPSDVLPASCDRCSLSYLSPPVIR